ncbi:hypothetical protein Agub_g11343, partial [Astrephomene gubernaculifera]
MEAALGLDLGSLLNQLAVTQQARSSAKLSERNVVELINKLRQLGILSEGELLHTLNGKEYLTVDRLRKEIQDALRQAGGRLALVELPTIVGVDYIHCERQAAAIVAESSGAVMEVQGELITTQYFDSIAAEINDQLQEAGQLNIGELAAQYGLATEMVLSVVSSRLGSTINGRLEGGLLYTPSYLRAIKAQLRGALRGAAGPVTIASLVREGALGPVGAAGGGTGAEAGAAAGGGAGGGLAAALAGGGGGGVIATLIEELVQEGSLRGSLRGGGSTWLPALHAEMQQEAVANFYSQNGWVAYDTVRRLGISNERAFLRSAFPEGLPLESAFVAPSLLAALEAAVEDVAAQQLTLSQEPPPQQQQQQQRVAAGGGGGAGGDAAGGAGAGVTISGGWLDVSGLLPSVLSGGDVAALLGRVALLREAERKPARERRVVVVGGTWVLSCSLLAALQERAEAEARAAARKALQDRKASGAAAGGSAAAAAAAASGGGKKKGGGGGAGGGDDDEDDWSMGSGKKGAKGKKGGKGSSSAAAATATASKGGGGGGKASAKGGGGASAGGGSGVGVSATQLAELLPVWCPDMEWGGEGGDDKAGEVAALLVAGAVAAYEQALQAAFTAGAEERRRQRDFLARQFEEAHCRLQLYGSGAEAFAEDEATYSTLQRHALRTAGAECADLLHRWARVEHQPEGAEQAAAAAGGAAGAAGAGGGGGFLSAAEVKQVLRAVPPDVAEGLAAAAEAPAAASVREAEALLERAAAAVGVRARRLDKKG